MSVGNARSVHEQPATCWNIQLSDDSAFQACWVEIFAANAACKDVRSARTGIYVNSSTLLRLPVQETRSEWPHFCWLVSLVRKHLAAVLQYICFVCLVGKLLFCCCLLLSSAASKVLPSFDFRFTCCCFHVLDVCVHASNACLSCRYGCTLHMLYWF